MTIIITNTNIIKNIILNSLKQLFVQILSLYMFFLLKYAFIFAW